MPKPTLYFLADWGKNKQLAWSGTNWGLFCALQKLFDVEDIDVTTYDPFHVRVLRKFNPLVKPLGLQLAPPKSTDMGRRKVRLGHRRALTAIQRGGKRDAVFQFSELVDERTCHMPTYLYIDLSVDAVADMKKHSPEIFQVSNYQMNKPFDIIRRGGAK